MHSALSSVRLECLGEGSWLAVHEPSGRECRGESREQAEAQMRAMLGLDESSHSVRALTSDSFEGFARELALYLEGPVSTMLALHDGYARLEAYHDGIASIRLGGGCEGCPSSRLTLANGVKRDLQDTFGEESILDVFPVLD